MAKYRLEQIAPVQQGVPPTEQPCWLLNLDMVESNTGRIIDYLFVEPTEIGASTIAFDTDNVLYSKLRPNLNKVVLPDRAGYATSEMLPLRPKKELITREYLTYFLRSQQFVSYISEKTSGAKMPRANSNDLKAIEIECPSIDKQKEITASLDYLVSIIGYRQKQLQVLDTLIKARFVEMFGDPEYNEKEWPIKKLNELCSIGSSKRIYQEEQSMEGIPFWRISDLVSKMDTGNVESSLFIPESRYEELKAQDLVPEPGDILVTSRGTLGRCYIVDQDDRFYFQDGMISWLSQYEDSITPLYIRFLFSMPGFRKQIDGMQAGSTVAYLSIAMLKKLDIMLPGRDAQEQFAAFVSLVDKSKVAVQAALEKAQLLFDSLMQQYFG